MKGKKALSFLLAAGMISMAATGCAGGAKKQENVTLKYVMAGPGMQANSQEVWAAFNDKLHEKLPNITVDFEIIPLSEYKQKVMLMMSAREQIDIINNYGLDFATEVSNGSFADMNDLLDKYGKEVRKTLPDWIWDYETVNGKIYGVPSYQMMGQTRCICFVKELADKYLDAEALRKALDSSKTFSQEVYDILGNYCKTLKDNGINFKTTSILNVKGYDGITNSYSVVYGDDACKVVNTYANDSAKLRYKTAKEWKDKGYIRPDALSATDDESYYGKPDGTAFWDDIYTPYQEKQLSEKYGTEILCIPYDTEPPIGGIALAGGTSIMASSKYPEEAMQFINLIQTDKELYNFLVFGREGVDYEKVGEDEIKTTYDSQGTANDKYGIFKWIVGNAELAYRNQSEDENYHNWAFNEVNSSTNRSKLIGFLPDTAAITDMLTQTDALRTQYLQPLNVGAVDNWEQNYEEFVSKLKTAGEDTIISELQKQVDEFLAQKKK